MHISSFETLDGLERSLSVDIESAEVDGKIDVKLRDIAKSAKFDGFRPGKVPLNFVKKRYYAGVRAEIIENTIRESLQQALEEKSLQPISMPDVEIKNNEEGGKLSFVARFEIYPTIELTDFSQLTIDKPVSKLEQKNVDKVISNLQRIYAQYEEVDRPAKEGDRVTADLDCIFNGEKLDKVSQKDSAFILDEQLVIPGMKDQLIGLKAGETKEISTDLPESFLYKDIAGQTVNWIINLKRVEETKLPSLDDSDFLKSCARDGKLENLQEDISKNLNTQLENSVKEELKQNLFTKLLENHDAILPKSLVEAEITALKKQAKDKQDIVEEEVRQQAENSVKLSLVIGEYIKQNEIKHDQQLILEKVKNIAVRYREPEAAMKNILNNQTAMRNIMSLALEEQAVESMLNIVQFNNLEKTFEELVRYY